MDSIIFKENYYFQEPEQSPYESNLYTLKKGGYVVVEDGFEITRGSDYEYHLVHYVYQGSGLLLVDGAEIQLKVGDVFVLSSGEPHIYAGNDDDKLGLMWIEFCGSNCAQLMQTILANGFRYASNPYSDKILHNMYDLILYVKNNHSLEYFNISLLIYTLLCNTMQLSVSSLSVKSLYPPHIDEAISYIKEHLCNLTIHGLSNHIGYSASHFTKLFSKAVGVIPSQYIMMKRIEQAAKLLEEGSPTCEELARKLGFYDATHFIKIYKKYTGHTPKKTCIK